MKNQQKFLLFIFTSIELITELVFKIKDGYNLELETPETMKLFGSTKKQNRESVPSLKEVEVVFVQWNLVDNQYQ